MNTLSISRKFHRFTVNAQTPFAKHFRIYDALDNGYVIMTDGKVIGTAWDIVQAQQVAIDYAKACECLASHAFSAKWYNEIKDRVPHGEPFYYVNHFKRLAVEVDVNEEIFRKVSTELGWM